MSRDDLRIIFVVGNSRSGTTMLGRILANHPCIQLFDEQHFFEEMWSPTLDPAPLAAGDAERLLARLITVHRDGYLYAGNPHRYIEEARAILATCHQACTAPDVYATFLNDECQRTGKTIACDHTPRNLYYIPEILALYPQAVIVNIVRDARGVLLSQKNRPWRAQLGERIPLWNVIRLWANYHPITMGMLWNSGINAGRKSAGDPRVISIRFEDVLTDPQVQIAALCAALHLDFQPEMLTVPQSGSSNVPARADKGIDPAMAFRWRAGGLSQTEIYLIERITQRNLSHHRYDLTYARPNPIMLAYLGLIWVIKAGLAFILNVRRVRNIMTSLRRRFLPS